MVGDTEVGHPAFPSSIVSIRKNRSVGLSICFTMSLWKPVGRNSLVMQFERWI